MAPRQRQRRSILPSLSDAPDQAADEKDTPATDGGAPTEPAGEAKATRSPARKTSARSTHSRATTESKTTPAGRQQRAAKDTTSTGRAATSRRSGGSEEQSSGDAVPLSQIRALWTGTAESKRLSLYVHPDDAYALGLQKLEDGADHNARIRAMIAVYRHDPRYRKAIDRIARTTPRGPLRGQPPQA